LRSSLPAVFALQDDGGRTLNRLQIGQGKRRRKKWTKKKERRRMTVTQNGAKILFSRAFSFSFFETHSYDRSF
jgi:hypothetical protein